MVKVIQGEKSHLLLTPVGLVGSARNSLLGIPQGRPHRCVTQWPPPHPSHVVWGVLTPCLGVHPERYRACERERKGTTTAVVHGALRELYVYLGQVS